MMKKLITCTCVLVILGSANSISYATLTIKNLNTSIIEATKIQPRIQIITPEKDSLVRSTNLVLEFTAPKETKITVKVYHNTSLEKDKEHFILTQDAIETEVGALEREWVQLELKRGLNKIEIIAEYKDGTSDTKTRMINVIGVEEVKKMAEKPIANTTSVIEGFTAGKKP